MSIPTPHPIKPPEIRTQTLNCREAKAERSRVRAAMFVLRYLRGSI